MTMRNMASRHVRQVAELARRLSREEIQELIQLVPQLCKEATGKQSDLVHWAREQVAQYRDESHPMQGEDAFIGDTTVEAYFALPEAERERIWNELYATAIETTQEREVKPDAMTDRLLMPYRHATLPTVQHPEELLH